MAEVMDEGEFWLPPKFLSDDDDNDERVTESKFCKSLDFGSPVESKSNEEDYYFAGLNRQMAHSSLKSSRSHGFTASQHYNSRDLLLYASVVEAARMQANNGDGYAALSHNVGPFAPERKHVEFGGYNTQLLSHQQMLSLKLQQQKIELAKRMMIAMGRMQQSHPRVIQNRGVCCTGVRNGGNSNPLGLSQTAWPSIQSAPQQQQQQQSNKRAVFVGNPSGKKECVGTGVFLPRRANTPTETPRKKPAKVLLSLNLEEMDGLAHFQARLNSAKLHPFYNNEGGPRVQGNNVAARPAQRLVSQEARLPHK